MSRRVGVVSVVVLTAGAAVLAAAGWWLAAVATAGVAAYAVGYCDWRSDLDARNAVIACLRADLDRAEARVAALEDERDSTYARRLSSRWVDERRLMPDNRPYLSAGELRNHTAATSTTTAAVDVDGGPAPVGVVTP